MTQRYDTYKDSGVQWLGEIPGHWKTLLNGILFIEDVRKPETDDIPLSLSQVDGVIPTDEMKESSLKTSSYDNWKRVIVNDLVLNIAAFIYVYLLLAFITTFVGTVGGLDVFQSFTASLSMLGSIGPAFGPFSEYSWIPGFVKWWYCFVMIAGRLEIYNLVILFTRAFWKK